MKFSNVVASLLLTSGAVQSLEIDSLIAEAKSTLEAQQSSARLAKSCTLGNVAVRREWSTLSKSEKLNYISAVQCLGKKPARTPAAIAAGAKSRYDDFVVTHIQQTRTIHFTGNFLSWHRYFVWSYEQALRNECGYKGAHPYYNWAKYPDPRKSPLFDGSETSLSGDGAFLPGRGDVCVPTAENCLVRLKPANGGGCVTKGPFKDWKVNLGPVQTIWPNIPPNPQANGLGYNPRCLSRELSPQAAMNATDDDIISLIFSSRDIKTFQDVMQNVVAGDLGLHGAGHYMIAGDANGDLYNSPADPAFFMHHSMIDLVWWVWQTLDLRTRANAIAGTITFMNLTPSRNTTLDDMLSVGYAGSPEIPIRNAMSTTGGPFCYIYL